MLLEIVRVDNRMFKTILKRVFNVVGNGNQSSNHFEIINDQNRHSIFKRRLFRMDINKLKK